MTVILTREELLWVEALESGEFEQCQGSLQQTGKFCCLGVGSEVAIRDGVVIEKSENEYLPGNVLYDGSAGYPSKPFLKWLLKDRYIDEMHTPIRIGDSTPIQMNDSEGKSFVEIAAEIRKYGVNR